MMRIIFFSIVLATHVPLYNALLSCVALGVYYLLNQGFQRFGVLAMLSVFVVRHRCTGFACVGFGPGAFTSV